MPFVNDTNLGKIQEILVQRINHSPIVFAGVQEAESFTQLMTREINLLHALKRGKDENLQ